MALATVGVSGRLVLVMAAVVLPTVDGPRDDTAPRPGRRRDLATVVVAIGLVELGTSVPSTYVSILLLDSGAAEGWIGPLLLVFGRIRTFRIALPVGLGPDDGELAGDRRRVDQREQQRRHRGRAALALVSRAAFPPLSGE